MTKFSSKTAHLISRLEKIASFYASRSEHAKANHTRGHVSDLRSSKMGGPQFAKLEKDTYQEAKILGIDWDNEWIPSGVSKEVIPPAPLLKKGDVLTLGKHTCTVDKGCDGYFLSANSVQNDELFTQFGLTNQDIRSYSGEGRQSQIFPEMLSLKRLTEVYHWLKEHEKTEKPKNPHAEALRYDKMRSYLFSRISEIRLVGISVHERHAADGFLQYLRDENHSQTYRAASWIFSMCRKYGITWSPGMNLAELEEYLNGLYGDQKQHIAGGESMQYESSIVVRLGNPCAEIELPMDSLTSQGKVDLSETEDKVWPIPTDAEPEVSKFLMIG